MNMDFYSNFDGPIVKTDKGQLRGYYANDVYKFRGIKYADAERFHSPHGVEPWDGVKTALGYGKVAPTIEDMGTSYNKMGIMLENRWMPQDESCQYLNVWTKSLNREMKKPVMVWLHGGGFFSGNTTEFACYDPANLCKFGDVVIVSINHRVNILGFLDLSEYGEEYHNSGNLGMEDIIAGLKWVQKNIMAFGGDPNNVTLFGHSGGGVKVTTLMQISEAANLFHKGIVQSGINIFRITPEKSRTMAKEIVEEIGGLDKLLNAPFRDLSDVFLKLLPGLRKKKLGEWGPVENGWYVGDPVFCGTTEKFKTTPLIVGSTIAETLMWEDVYYDGNAPEEKKREYIRERYGEHTDIMIEMFQKAYPTNNLIDLRYLDTLFRPKVYRYLDKRSEIGSAETYSYILAFEFNFNGSTPAFHTSEHSLVFRNMDKMEFVQVDGIEKISEEISNAWISFARGGNPNNETLSDKWLPFRTGDEHTFVFDKFSECRGDYDRQMYDYLEHNCNIRVLPVDD